MSKLDRVNAQITQAKDKIAALTERLRELERQKTDLENADMLKMIHGFNASKEELEAFFQSREGGSGDDSVVRQNAFPSSDKEGV